MLAVERYKEEKASLGLAAGPEGPADRPEDASGAVCPGCEQQCVMPVQIMAGSADPSSAFIVCDQRDDINRVPVDVERLTGWQTSVNAVCDFVAACLGLRCSSQHIG